LFEAFDFLVAIFFSFYLIFPSPDSKSITL
jgi:hypothetical protein